MKTDAATVTLNRIEARIEARMMALAAEGRLLRSEKND